MSSILPTAATQPATSRADAGSIGLALGGGAARGLAHVLILEALDELGVRPIALAGTSMGAIVGASYAAGLSGRDIRAHFDAIRGQAMSMCGTPIRRLHRLGLTAWRSSISIESCGTERVALSCSDIGQAEPVHSKRQSQ